MTNWKFSDTTNKTVFRINENGECESCLVEAIAYWLSEGNEPEPADIIPVPVPQLLTSYQGKVTLDAFQMYEEVEQYMQLETTSRAAKLAWATGSFERQGSLIISLAADFGITDEQLDTMFIYGSKVQ